jgi:hypothetical protein
MGDLGTHRRVLTLVRLSVTVVIRAIAELGDAGVHTCVQIVAVARCAADVGARGSAQTLDLILETVGVTVLIEPIRRTTFGADLIGRPVTVVIDRVADLLDTRIHVQVEVVAVAELRRPACAALAETLAVELQPVLIEVIIAVLDHAIHRPLLVDLTIAIVVEAITVFSGARVDARDQLVAIAARRHPTRTGALASARWKSLTVAIPVRVQEEVRALGRLFVDLSIAVVVQTIADLRRRCRGVAL